MNNEDSVWLDPVCATSYTVVHETTIIDLPHSAYTPMDIIQFSCGVLKWNINFIKTNLNLK